MADTIFALSSGRPPAGVAIVRISGPAVRFVCETMLGKTPPARRAALVAIRHPLTDALLDRGLVLFFPGPASFTGEDVVEFHVHGGRAVVAAVLAALSTVDGCRPAEAGEFSRRAFENGRIDLTEVEGLGDLVAAETEAQRRQALAQAGGRLREKTEAWREGILRAEALIEADLDFADEEDVPVELTDAAKAMAASLGEEIRMALADGHRGERLRDGFEVALMGPPNAGKSTLLNVLAGRDVAIVTDQPGTTRDIVEVHLDLGGFPVNLIDTAGLRAAGDVVEAEGIRRARARGGAADLVLWLDEFGGEPPRGIAAADRVMAVMTKTDLGRIRPDGRMAVSCADPASITGLIALIARKASDALGGEDALITATRQRRCLEAAATALEAAATTLDGEEIVAEHLRAAATAMGRLSGRIDVEDVLGEIFSRFCIGK